MRNYYKKLDKMKTIDRNQMLDTLTAVSNSLVTNCDDGETLIEPPGRALRGIITDLISAGNEIDDDEEFRSVALLTYTSLRAWWTVVISRTAYQFGEGEKSAILHDKADAFGDALCVLEEFLGARDVDSAVNFLTLANSSDGLSAALRGQSELDVLCQTLGVKDTGEAFAAVGAMRQQLQAANSKVKRLTFALGRRSPYAERAANISSTKHRQRLFDRSPQQLLTAARHKRLGLVS